MNSCVIDRKQNAKYIYLFITKNGKIICRDIGYYVLVMWKKWHALCCDDLHRNYSSHECLLTMIYFLECARRIVL